MPREILPLPTLCAALRSRGQHFRFFRPQRYSNAHSVTALLIALALALVCPLSVVSCSKAAVERDVSGQVFIVKRNGETVKLALVEVRLYETRVLQEHFSKAQPQIVDKLERAEAVEAEAATAASNAEIELT